MDLKGKIMLPIHNGTFDLSFHEWTDPFERIQQLANENLQTLATPQMGQRWLLDDAAPQTAWWKLAEPEDMDALVQANESLINP